MQRVDIHGTSWALPQSYNNLTLLGVGSFGQVSPRDLAHDVLCMDYVLLQTNILLVALLLCCFVVLVLCF